MARAFHFSLQRVLEYRVQLEDQARMAVAKALKAYMDQVAAVEGLRGELERHEASLYSQPLTAEDLWLWRNYKQRLLQDLAEGEVHMLELARQLNRRRQEAVARSKERKLLEKLKDNQRKRHVKNEQDKEQREFDEAATVRYEPQTV